MIRLQNALAAVVISALVLAGGSEAREKVKLRLYTFTLGSAGYVLGTAWADIVSKTVPWIEMNNLEGRSGDPNQLIIVNDPARKRDTIVFSVETSFYGALAGKPPYKQPYPSLRAIGSYGWNPNFLLTFDPKIKTLHDLRGKRLFLLPRATFPTKQLTEALKKRGLWDSVSVTYGTFEAAKDALQDGLVDAAMFSASGFPSTGFQPNPAMLELIQTAKIYWVAMSEGEVKQSAQELLGVPLPLLRIPKAAMHPEQPELYTVFSLGFWADLEMPEDVVYEVTKAMGDNTARFQTYHALGKNISKQTMGLMTVSAKYFHPGALRYYRENGIKPGTGD